jgi:ParB family chromosome partitioning protein
MRQARRVNQRLSDNELRAASAQGMDLEQMADLADAQDVPGAGRVLQEALEKDQHEGGGGRGYWDHAMAQLREEQRHRQAREEAIAQLEKQQIPLLPDRLPWGQKDLSRPLSQLTTSLLNELTEDKHRGCPGHSARLDEDNQPVWYCSDPDRHGHKIRPEAQQAGKTPSSPRSREQRARTIAGNRQWRTAQGVRREFISGLCGRKGLPEPLRRFALKTVLTMPHHYSRWVSKKDPRLAVAFLDGRAEVAEDATASTAAKTVERLPKARESQGLFAHVAAAFEYDIRESNAWTMLDAQQAAWLLLLEQHGYTLAEVEQEAVAAHRPKKTEPAS